MTPSVGPARSRTPDLLQALAGMRPGPGGANLPQVCRMLFDALRARSVALELIDGRVYGWPPRPSRPPGTRSARRRGERAIPLQVAGERVADLRLDLGGRSPGGRHKALLAEVVDLLGPLLHLALVQAELDESLESARGHAERVSAVRRRSLAERDAERGDLERDLHDGAQHHLVALGMRLGLLEVHAANQNAPALSEQLLLLKEGVGRAESTLRSIAAGDSPAVLQSSGLYAALTAEVRDAGEQVGVLVAPQDEGRRYPSAVETAVFFITLEAVNNARKHAAGARITVSLDEGAGGLGFAVSDQGPGLDRVDAVDSFGLENMRRRIIAAGGRMQVRTSVGGGTTVAGFIPL